MTCDDGFGRHAYRLLAALAADDTGHSDQRPPLLLLHGLTFDRQMWRPALKLLDDIDPRRRAVALDLPGHGDSPSSSSYGIEDVVGAVHAAVQAAGLERPVVVGHSLGAILATVYAARFPTRGVVNVDQPLDTGAFAELVRSMADQLRGPEFPSVWNMFASSFHTELLPPSAAELVRTTSKPRQAVVLGYWHDVLARPPAELARWTESTLAGLQTTGVPYDVVAGAEPDVAYRTWLARSLPQARMTIWPGSGHFPHLAHPDWFAQILASDHASQLPAAGGNGRTSQPGVG